MTGRTILSVAYGIDAKDSNDYYVSLAQKALDVVAKATEKGRLINLIPARMSMSGSTSLSLYLPANASDSLPVVVPRGRLQERGSGMGSQHECDRGRAFCSRHEIHGTLNCFYCQRHSDGILRTIVMLHRVSPQQ